MYIYYYTNLQSAVRALIVGRMQLVMISRTVNVTLDIWVTTVMVQINN